MKEFTVAATQMACSWDSDQNIATAEKLIRQAVDQGAEFVLIQELFETPYFCIEQNFSHLKLATALEDSKGVNHMQSLARELSVVVPVSFFERAGNVTFNTVAMIDADGTILGKYRKSHIPNAVLYQEKEYFSPGDTGFRVWDTRYAKIGVAICWDQWFPEAARCMALQGAEILAYPTAIGSEQHGKDDEFDSRPHWQNTMCGHAAANIMPVVASNRIGHEQGSKDASLELTFYGSSFIADHTGVKVAECNRTDQQVITSTFDLDKLRNYRQSWGVFRDRRPDLYGALGTLDGQV
jgi:N-carbamoylputrescine amidase